MTARWIALAAATLLVAGCDSLSKGPYAEAQVQGAAGTKIWGRITFHQPEGGTLIGDTTGYKAPVATAAANASVGRVYIRADINGLPPGRSFGFHVHEKGDCSSADFTSAGGHFNPDGKPHGGHATPERHAGDMPNLTSDGEGIAVFAATTDLLTVAPGPRSVVSRSVIIHANPDDYKTQPTGNSGARIACGVIVAKD